MTVGRVATCFYLNDLMDDQLSIKIYYVTSPDTQPIKCLVNGMELIEKLKIYETITTCKLDQL